MVDLFVFFLVVLVVGKSRQPQIPAPKVEQNEAAKSAIANGGREYPTGFP